MEYRILGPLEVIDDHGSPVSVGAARERAVLALLLLSANTVVSAQTLTDSLFGPAPPEGAGHALQVYVSRLRKALRESGQHGVLLTKPPGYLLRIDPLAVDAARFAALVNQARDQARDGDHTGAAVRFRQALALWRGPALADLLDAPAAQAEATRLEEARLAAVEERVDADLASGAHGELAAELEALTRAYPLRERLWAQRMVALYRSGRQAEALRVYQDLRRILGEELGLEPSAALAGVEVAILRHDAALDWRPAQSAVSASAGTPPPATSGGVVTFLFTDLVGSTALLDRLGEDAFDDLRRTHFSLLRQAVSDAGGHEVKNLGDGIMVAFASPVAALGAAIAIQRAVAEHNRSSADRALSLRVGLQSGEATREESDFFGTAVVVAKRLCDQAPGGRIFAGELVAALVGSRGAYQFRPLGHLSLKGLATPVPAVEVDWQPVPSSVTTDADAASPGPPAPVPLPRLLTGIGRVFVGRDGELERLRIAWKAAAGSGPRLVMVAGEPGVGKTRLTAALAAEVHAEGATVLAGRCDEDLGVPYQPFVHALRHLVDHTPGSHLSRRLGRYGGELTRLVPDLTERAPGLGAPLHADPETEQYRLFDAVAAWLDATAAEAPLLLVLDDLQWAAKPTLLLLRHIVRTGEHRLLIVGTYRDTELSRTHPLSGLLADLRRDGEAERIALTGLDAAGVAAFLEQAAGNELSEDDWELARAIHGETEGNPFFVGEVVRHLVESGAVVRRDGRWVTEAPINELGIPEGVRDVVGRRLSRLSEAANQLLAIAAVVGLEFDPAVVEAAGGADEDTVAASLDEAVAARLVTPAGGVHYRFAHALVRTTLYDELTPARRVILHRRTAEAIETIHAVRLDDYLPALTHHYSRATAPVATAEKAVGYARRAGDRALEQLAHDEAVAYYRQALELLEASEAPLDETQRTELLIALGEAQRRAGDTGHRETLLAAARLAASRADAAALARAALANSPGSKPAAFGVTDSDRVEVLEAAAAAVGNGDSATRARLLAILALELFHDADRRRRLALSDEALAIARRLGDPVTLAQVLVARPFAIGGPDTLGERLANTTELLDVAERLGDPVTAHRAWWLRFRVAVEVADRAEADRCLQAQQPLVAELGQPVFSWMTNLQRIAGHFRAGRIGEAEPLLYAAFDEGQRAGQADAALYFAIHLFHLGYEQGRLAEFRGPLMEVFERPSQLPFVGATRAVVHCELGDLDAARAELEQLASVDFGDLQIEASWVVALCYCAVACAALDDRDRAGALVRLLEPYADHVAVFAVGLGIGCVSHYLGLLTTTLGRLDEADVHFTNACAVHGRMDAPGWLARTHLEWGRVLLHRRQRSEEDRARELLGQAVSTARELGLTGVERRAVELLA